QDWVPAEEGTSLYVRPFIIATESYLGIAPSTKYRFMIILSPVGAYYKEGINPVKIAVENKYVRAVLGGTGEAKTAGNYAYNLKIGFLPKKVHLYMSDHLLLQQNRI